MENQKVSYESHPAAKAFKIGFVSIFTYIISYYVRNLLGVFTPDMVKSGTYTEEYLALLASVYMVVYAAGQIINGIIGDIVKPKYMVSMGLSITALGLIGFSFAGQGFAGIVCFGAVGFGLSMLRGPLVKVISENTLPKYARLCCVFLSFASFAGPLLAGIAAMILKWNSVFAVSGIITLAMAVFSFTSLTIFEKKGMIVPLAAAAKTEKSKIDIFSLFKLPNFATFLCVAVVVEISAISINYWMPSFFTNSLHFSKSLTNTMFSIISLCRALMPFVSLYIFKLLKENDITILRVFFSLAAVLLFLVYLIQNPVPRLIFFTLSLMCCSVASATLWSIYIPNLGKSGKVSSVNGVIDCTGYIGAAVFNVAVVPIMDAFGWGGTILSWCGIMLAGLFSTFLAKKHNNI